MGFSQELKTQILVETARHCCLCHRYKGVKVEVHHIKPEASGGSNTYENAIALCFDCHADAGHYNNHHPRGTKISYRELYKAKEEWIKKVAENKIETPQNQDKFHCRYYICKSFSHLSSISNGDLSFFPVEKPLLVKNEIISQISIIISKHPFSNRITNSFRGKSYLNKEDYLFQHPDVITSDCLVTKFPYFSGIRTPSRQELSEFENQDGLLKLMLENNIKTNQIAIVSSYSIDCDGIVLLEEYILREIWCSFLAITNITDKLISLNNLTCQIIENSNFQEMHLSSDITSFISLPKVKISPKTTVIIPLSIIIPPFFSLMAQRWKEYFIDEKNLYITHESFTSVANKDCLVFGNQILPKSIEYIDEGIKKEQSIHEFDMSNMYIIDEFWECGCCPHLFYISDKIIYSRELLAKNNSKIGVDDVIVPLGVTKIIIAELEEETTFIAKIFRNDDLIMQNQTLERGQIITIDVKSYDHIQINGQYVPKKQELQNTLSGALRNRFISEFLIENKFETPNNPVAHQPRTAAGERRR